MQVLKRLYLYGHFYYSIKENSQAQKLSSGCWSGGQ